MLYSDKASRPNTPVNVIVGVLIIKELFDYSDDEMVENLMLDFRVQYALHTTSFDEQPLSDKTLSRFRKRCYEYETLCNKDFYHDFIKDLSISIAKLIGISGKVRRMDSKIIESNIRKLSLTGKQTRDIFASFEFNEEGTKVFKRVAKIVASKAAHARAKIQRNLDG